jgi:hypothetical protein
MESSFPCGNGNYRFPKDKKLILLRLTSGPLRGDDIAEYIGDGPTFREDTLSQSLVLKGKTRSRHKKSVT